MVAWFGYARPTYAFFVIAAFLLAHRLRQEDFRSLPDILEKYYGRKTRYVGAAASFIYSLPALSLYGFGMLGEVILGCGIDRFYPVRDDVHGSSNSNTLCA